MRATWHSHSILTLIPRMETIPEKNKWPQQVFFLSKSLPSPKQSQIVFDRWIVITYQEWKIFRLVWILLRYQWENPSQRQYTPL